MRWNRKKSVATQSNKIKINHAPNSQSGTLPALLIGTIARKTISVMLPHSTNLFPGLFLNKRQKNSPYRRKTNKPPPRVRDEIDPIVAVMMP